MNILRREWNGLPSYKVLFYELKKIETNINCILK